jgi:hypothetical protein
MMDLSIILCGGFLLVLAVCLVWAIWATWRDETRDGPAAEVRPKHTCTELVVGRQYLVRSDELREWHDAVYLGLDLDGYRWFFMVHLGKEVGFSSSTSEALFDAHKVKYVWTQPAIPDRINHLTGKKI